MPKQHTRLYKAIEDLGFAKTAKKKALGYISKLENGSTKTDYGRLNNKEGPESRLLCVAFGWHHSPQRHKFWQRIHDQLQMNEKNNQKA